jgi:hypothetical protein
MDAEILKKGDYVVMHTCIEAKCYTGKLWKCRSDQEINSSGNKVVFLEGFSGSFSSKHLQKVNINSLNDLPN